MELVIINTRVANLTSVAAGFRRLGQQPRISAEPEVIRSADRVVLPGVGTAAAAMRSLHELQLAEVISSLTQPVLGICLGMQVLTESSAESSQGRLPCLNLIPGTTEKLPGGANLPLPHMGWNQTQVSEHPLFNGLNAPWFYYVHSYGVQPGAATVAQCTYAQPFAAAIARANFMGVQFHPERSGADGARVLQNFLEVSC